MTRWLMRREFARPLCRGIVMVAPVIEGLMKVGMVDVYCIYR